MSEVATEMAAMTRPTGSVVMPAYNESASIASTLHRVAATLVADLPDRDWEIVVVDDGSVDSTAMVADAVAADVEARGVSVRILQHAVNRGLGAALQTAIAATRGDVVVVVDCDLSYDPGHVTSLVRALEARHAQVAVASPYMEGGRTISVPRHIERRSRMANAFLARISGSSVSTLTGMVRAYNGPFVRALALKSVDDVINVEALYKTGVLRGRIVEVPATLDWSGLEQRAGRTSIRSRRTRSKTYQTVISGVLFRPYLMFAAGGMALFLLGAFFGLGAILLPSDRVALTVFGATLMVTGVLCGLVSVLSIQVKRCFEELYFLHSGARLHVSDTIVYRAPSVSVEVTAVVPQRHPADVAGA